MPAPEDVHAEVLLWQARYRVTLVSLLGFATITLKWFGVTSAESVFASGVSERSLLMAVIGLMLVYLIGHRMLRAYLLRQRRASMRLVIGAIASDVVLLFAGVLLMTPPEFYVRALVVAIFTVQFTQLFFGWGATIANLVLIALGYTTLVAVASDAGILLRPQEELWTLTLYAIGVLVLVALQAQVASRMHRLMELFHKAQEGDFSQRFEEREDEVPDPVSVIGRAYNRMREHLQAIVFTDPLSGCYNRRGLNQMAEREVSRAIRNKKELAVLAIDLDHFKRVNDEFGHLTGDEVIREVGHLLRNTAREADVVARFGGEEFTILAPDSGEEGALILADRVMEAFRAYRFRSLPPEFRMTASVGVAADFARDDQVSKTLIARADEALYVAKRNGRDRSVVWHAGMRAFDGSPARGRSSVVGMLRITE
ncbi:MAG: GGDEF domain-containing protein [Gemmatimonadaceae bacterium]|nr:GGDEF domain-containing protein [Gemmatimonadaceae bacterium]MCW5826358.1 GGDEF domain-containing protein [Gemmatimonadaceae bacterium]